jgi:glycosyltransferase involved in cell wall biosynthesis
MSGPPALRVALLHNYRDEQQPSMRLYAERLGEGLARHGVSVARVRPADAVPQPWRRRSAALDKLDMYLGRFVVYPRVLRGVVRAEAADVMHVVDHGDGHLVSGLPARRTLVTCHDLMLLALASGRIGGARVPQVALALFRISLEFVKRAALIIADSTQTKRDLVNFLDIDPDKVTVIFPGLNQLFANDRQRGLSWRSRFGLGEGPLILQVGQMFYKNIPGVLRVVQRLRREGLGVRLVRVGRALAGAERALAEKLGVSDAVVELGGISDGDVPSLYNAVDLLLFPSLYEGFGWPPLEAMASGTPVVCSRAGSLDEIVGDAALTADPEDVEALTWHAAAVLTQSALRDRLVERGLERARHFDWERTAEQVIGAYRGVIERAA